MYTVLLVIHTIVVLFLIGIILIQRSDQDGMGLSGGGSQFMSGRASANFLTRTTSILATIFIISSLILGMMVAGSNKRSVIDAINEDAPAAAAPATAGEKAPAEPAKPAVPSVPKPE